jgi:hypothetical protein
MTPPILARFFQRRSASLGISVALLYGANTVGAACGALLAGYLVIPALGMFKTTLATALLNLVVAALALRLFGRLPAEAIATPLASAAPPAAGADPGARRLGRLALLLLALGGVVTLALEVNYIHLLAVVAGNSVYAFSLMLFAFLLGLAGGAQIAHWLPRAARSRCAWRGRVRPGRGDSARGVPVGFTARVLRLLCLLPGSRGLRHARTDPRPGVRGGDAAPGAGHRRALPPDDGGRGPRPSGAADPGAGPGRGAQHRGQHRGRAACRLRAAA